jgi:hypothetical protein
VSDDQKAGHWPGLFGHGWKEGMGEVKVDTEEGMRGRDYDLELAELIGREKTVGRFLKCAPLAVRGRCKCAND